MNEARFKDISTATSGLTSMEQLVDITSNEMFMFSNSTGEPEKFWLLIHPQYTKEELSQEIEYEELEEEPIEDIKHELLEAGKEFLAWKQGEVQLRSLDDLVAELQK